MDDQLTEQRPRCPENFDHHSAEHAAVWPDTFKTMREDYPRVWSDKYDGFWVATRFKDILAIAQKPEFFSTEKLTDPQTGAPSGGAQIPTIPGPPGVPQETASPEWDAARGFINRKFAPRAVETFRARAKHFVAALVDKFIETGKFDIVHDLTNPLPAIVTMELFGLPLDDWATFADPLHRIMYTPRDDPEFMEAIGGLDQIMARIDQEVIARRENPQDDLLGYLANGTIDDKPLEPEFLRNMAYNLLVGGVDTTTALTSHTLLYLARNPEDRARLIEDPSLIRLACEEFLRFFSPVHHLARTATADIEVDGWRFLKGERVMLAYASANRDPEMFENPETVVLDRFPNRHIAFGAGQHRCIGSFLARMMFQVMLEEILTRLPDYQVVEDGVQPYRTIGTLNGYIQIPATFTPGPKVGAEIS